MEFLIQLLNGVQYGLLLFLLASGLTLIFGIMGVINLAHGSFYMIGAYLAWWLTRQSGSLWIAIPVGLVIAAALGMLLEKFLFARLYKRDHLDQVLLTYGLILVFEELRSILFGDDVQGVTAPDLLSGSIPLTSELSYPVYRLFVSGACLLVAFGLYWMIQRTRLGMRVRAGSSNRDMAQSLGVDIDRLFMPIFALGVVLAALAGMLAAPLNSVYPGMGGQILILCFVVVVIGGIGSVKGALIGALLIGLVDTLGKILLPDLSGALIYLVMAAVLVFRPNGLFGKA